MYNIICNFLFGSIKLKLHVLFGMGNTEPLNIYEVVLKLGKLYVQENFQRFPLYKPVYI